jgi:hypothetical protein
MISAPSTALSVANLKRSRGPKPGRTSELRPGATALYFAKVPKMNPDRLIGALSQPGLTRAGRGNILDLATSMGSGPSITPKKRKE